MTNLKKLGLTALAGSLVATSAFAGSLGVSGIAKVSYASGNNGAVNGNPLSMDSAYTFSGSGELDNGMTVSVNHVMTASSASFSSSGIILDMGDAGTLSFSNGQTGGHGIHAYQDKMPTAAEQVWDDLDGEANGLVSMNETNTIGYGTSFSGVNVSANYNKQESGGSAYSIAADMSPMDGLMVFAAVADKYAGPNSTTDEYTVGGTYTSGPITAGIQRSSIDLTAADSDTDRTHIAASFAVNEDLSLSVGRSVVEFENSALTDQEDTGFSVSYTMGSISITAAANSSDNVSGTSGTDDEHKEMNIAFAF
jgi:outer membrane protein OmpU